jgi:hypothetical protein
MFVQLALPRHARESESSLSLGAFSLIPNSKVEPRAAPLFVSRVFSVFGHTQVPRAVARSFCTLEVRVVKSAVEDEAVDGVVRQGWGRRAVHRVAAPRRWHWALRPGAACGSLGEPGAALIDAGPALCYRGERSRLLRCARCSPVSRVHPFQSLIAAAFAPVGPGCGGACPGFREPSVRFPPGA